MEIEVKNTPQKDNTFGMFRRSQSNDYPMTAARLTVNNSADYSDTVKSMSSASNTDKLDEAYSPPAKRFHRVRNPFEAAMTGRLHLPLIESPSLFQRPTTPQMSSTKFEWTIEDVASLKPADVEPHETQFHDSPDPEYEAKAQSAISSFFKDQQIVPSPVDCPLRNQRIILSELNGNTPMSKPGRRIRDCGSQTELTFPAILPPELELALRPYLQPELAGPGFELKRRFNADLYFGRGRGSTNDENIEELSLRRKLFDMNNVIVLEELSPMSSATKVDSSNSGAENVKDISLRRKLFDIGNVMAHDDRPSTSTMMSATCNPCSPMLLHTLQRTAIAGHLSDSPSELSPIFARSPPSSHKNSVERRKALNISDLDSENLSPIMPLKRNNSSRISRFQYRSDTSALSDHTFGNVSAFTSGDKGHTADQGSSPLPTLEAAETSIDNSFHVKIAYLKVNDASIVAASTSEWTSAEPRLMGIITHNDTTETFADDDDVQMLQLSTRSLNCSTQSDTPRVKRFSASRKNLSRSFWFEESDDDEEEMEHDRMPPISGSELNKIIMSSGQTVELEVNVGLSQPRPEEGSVAPAAKLSPHASSVFYRTDSGFNEMTTSSSYSSAPWPGIDANIVSTSNDKEFSSEKFLNETRNMGCSSTPSKRHPTRLSIDDEDTGF